MPSPKELKKILELQWRSHLFSAVHKNYFSFEQKVCEVDGCFCYPIWDGEFQIYIHKGNLK